MPDGALVSGGVTESAVATMSGLNGNVGKEILRGTAGTGGGRAILCVDSHRAKFAHVVIVVQLGRGGSD